MNPRDVPIPLRMRDLPRDHRGFPVPINVYVDGDGRPHFTVNLEGKRVKCLMDDLCSICGKSLLRGRWFVGGPASAFHPQGAYNDPPMHDECAHYALQVCPWLAAPNYARRIDNKTLKPDDLNRLNLHDPTMIPNRPKVFVALMAVGQMIFADAMVPSVRPKKPFRKVEYWVAGKQVDWAEGEALAADSFREVKAYLEQQREMKR